MTDPTNPTTQTAPEPVSTEPVMPEPTTDIEWEASAGTPVLTEPDPADPAPEQESAGTKAKAKGKTTKSKAKAPAKAKAPKAAKNGDTRKAQAGDRRLMGADRRSRGLLAADVKTVTDDFDADKLSLEKGEKLTPHRISTLLVERDGLEHAPSAGAISNVLAKWSQVGYAKISDGPQAYAGISARGRKDGLEVLMEKHRDKLKKERQAARAAAKGDEAK